MTLGLLVLTWVAMLYWTAYQRIMIEFSQWRAAIRVTPLRIAVARVLLLIAGFVCLVFMGLLVLFARRHSYPIEAGIQGDAMFAMEGMSAGIFLATNTYVALHWAYRPENFLPSWALRLSEPFFGLLRPRKGSGADDLLKRYQRINHSRRVPGSKSAER